MSKVKEVYRFVLGTNMWDTAVGAMRTPVNGGIPPSVQSTHGGKYHLLLVQKPEDQARAMVMLGGKPPVWTGAVTDKV